MQQHEQQDPMPGSGAPPTSRARRRYSSLFWAMVLLGVGVVALLANLDVIQPASLAMLTYLWPLLLIGAAVDLIVGRHSLLAGSLVGAVTVGLIIALMFIGPTVGWTGSADLTTSQVSAEVGEATSAEVTIITRGYSADVHGLPASDAAERPLLDGSVTFRGAFRIDEEGGLRKVITLAAEDQDWWWQWFGLSEADTWDIGLDPVLPLDLVVDSSSGSTKLDLSTLALKGLEATMSSGDMDIELPVGGEEAYLAALRLSSGDLDVRAAAGARADMTLDMSSGDVHVVLGAGSAVTLVFKGSSGKFTLDLAPDQALRVEVKSVSSGSIVWPNGITQVADADDKEPEGIYETPGYSTAPHKVLVIVEHMSSGSIEFNR